MTRLLQKTVIMTEFGATVLCIGQALGGTSVAQSPIYTDNTWETKVVTEKQCGTPSTQSWGRLIKDTSNRFNPVCDVSTNIWSSFITPFKNWSITVWQWMGIFIKINITTFTINTIIFTAVNIANNLLFLPPFSFIRDFGKQYTRGNASKISVSLTCYWQIRSKSNCSH